MYEMIECYASLVLIAAILYGGIDGTLWITSNGEERFHRVIKECWENSKERKRRP